MGVKRRKDRHTESYNCSLINVTCGEKTSKLILLDYPLCYPIDNYSYI